MRFEFLRFLKRNVLLFKANKDINYKSILYVNWWSIDAQSFWFTKLIDSIDTGDLRIRFYSVFGPRKRVNEVFDGIKIFYSGENLEPFEINKNANHYFVYMVKKRISKYGNYCIGDVDLSLGYAIRKETNYLRIPLWIIDNFEPTQSLSDIQKKLDGIEYQKKLTSRINGAVLMCSHDDGGTRKEIIDKLNEIMVISLPGKYMHNTGDLWISDKIAYLEKYKFCICPENVDAIGYVSEKLIDALKAGCIPIYVGAKKKAEIKIFNQSRIIYWNIGGDNIQNIQLIRELLEDESKYLKFAGQPLFCNDAGYYIFDIIDNIKNYIVKIVNEKRNIKLKEKMLDETSIN